MIQLESCGVQLRLHAACAVATLGKAELIALPPPEKGKLAIADTGIELMRELLASEDGQAQRVSTR